MRSELGELGETIKTRRARWRGFGETKVTQWSGVRKKGGGEIERGDLDDDSKQDRRAEPGEAKGGRRSDTKWSGKWRLKSLAWKKLKWNKFTTYRSLRRRASAVQNLVAVRLPFICQTCLINTVALIKIITLEQREKEREITTRTTDRKHKNSLHLLSK